MSKPRITVETELTAPLEKVWSAYTSPEAIVKWNAASDDWHTTKAEVDLREGGVFSSRMEAKDGSFGFDFAGTYTKIIPHALISYSFGDRACDVHFSHNGTLAKVVVSFDPEETNPVEMQKGGWQAILSNFKKYVEAN